MREALESGASHKKSVFLGQHPIFTTPYVHFDSWASCSNQTERYLAGFVTHAIQINSINKLIFAYKNVPKLTELTFNTIKNQTLKNQLAFGKMIHEYTCEPDSNFVENLADELPQEITTKLEANHPSYPEVLKELNEAFNNTEVNNNNNNNNSEAPSFTQHTQLINKALINVLTKTVNWAWENKIKWDPKEPVLAFLLKARANLMQSENTLNFNPSMQLN